MKSKNTTIKLVAVSLAFICMSAYGAIKCGIDGMDAVWTGKTMVDKATAVMLYEIKCVNGHVSWASQI